MPARAFFVAFVLALLALLPNTAAAAPAFTTSCDRALAKDQVEDLVARMREAAEHDPCTLLRVDTAMYRTTIEWRFDGETSEVLLGPVGCLLEPSREGERLAFHASASLGTACPAALAQLEDFVGEPRVDLLPVVRDQIPVYEDVDDSDPLAPLVVAGTAWLATLVLLIATMVTATRRRRDGGRDAPGARAFALAAGGLFVLGLGARAWVGASLGNWYGPFLPPEGWGDLRFGAGAAVLQAVVRGLVPWTAPVAFGLARLLGALAIPLVMLVVRRLGGSLGGAFVAGLLLALAPIAVRLSASSSEHVLAGTLALAAWAVWLRTATDVSVVPRLLAICLVAVAALTRADCWPQLCLIPLWTVLVVPDERLGWQPLARRIADAAWFGLCWAAIGVYLWFRVVLVSNHPGPESEAIRGAARALFGQLWAATIEPPHWISPVCFVLAVLGFAVLLARRRLGVAAAAVVSLALIFVPLGRGLTPDGLVGARYFVLVLPLVCVVASACGDALDEALTGPRARLRRPVLAASGVLVVALEILGARPGWTYEYTFQAEYRFLADELGERDVDGCTLWFVRPRQATAEVDLDCCLAPDRSPLTLVAPGLQFRAVSPTRAITDEQGCHLYYVGSVCSVEPELAARVPEGVARIHEQCDRLRDREAELLRERELTDASIKPRFSGPPVVELRGRR